MRVTQGTGQLQFLQAVNQLEASLSQTENQLGSNKSFTTASQAPVAAGQVNGYQQALSQNQQFSSNAQSAQTNLQTEDNAVAQVQNQLQTLRTLALEANSGTLSATDRKGIASQVQEIQQALVGLANTQNGQGEYLFSGYATTTQPFAITGTGASYAGDQGQRQVQIAAGQSVADGDNGDTVFNQIKTGNGTFQVTAAAANTGGGIIGATTVTDPKAYDGGTYTINFTAPDTYQVLDAGNNVVSSGNYTDGESISFKGVQVALSGTPAANDSFTVSASSNQSIFATVQNLITGLQASANNSISTNQLNNLISDTVMNIDQTTTSLSGVRASIGGRLNAITSQQAVATSQSTQLQLNISNLQGLDYAAAITTLTQQQTTLSAALQSYTLTQGLSLFKFLQ